jgi:hypothetical protein
LPFEKINNHKIILSKLEKTMLDVSRESFENGGKNIILFEEIIRALYGFAGVYKKF